MGKQGAEPLDKALVITVHGHVEAAGQVVFQLGWIRDGLAVLPHISQGPGEQVGVPFLAEAKNHRGAHIEGVAGSLETAAAASRNQIALQHQHLGPFGRQLAGGDQPANAGADHDHVPIRAAAHRAAAVASATLGAEL